MRGPKIATHASEWTNIGRCGVWLAIIRPSPIQSILPSNEKA